MPLVYGSPVPGRRDCADVLLTVDHHYGTTVVTRVHPIMAGTPAHLDVRYSTKEGALFLRDAISVTFQHTLDHIGEGLHRGKQSQSLSLQLLNQLHFDSVEAWKTSEFPLWLDKSWDKLDSLLLDCFEGTEITMINKKVFKTADRPCPTLKEWRDTHYPRQTFFGRLIARVFEGFGLH